MSRSSSPASSMSQHDKLMDFVSETMTTVDDVARKWSSAFTKITCEEEMAQITNSRTYFNELLLQQMIKLDNVEADDDNELRNARKCVIHKIQAYIRMLEIFATENDSFPIKEEETEKPEESEDEEIAGENSSDDWEVPEPMSEDELEVNDTPQQEEVVEEPEVVSPKPIFETPVAPVATEPVEPVAPVKNTQPEPEPEPEDEAMDESEDKESTPPAPVAPVAQSQPQRPTQQELFRMHQLEQLRQEQAREEQARQRQAMLEAQRERQQQRILRQRKQQEAERRRQNPFFGFDDRNENPFGFNTSRYPSSRNRSHTSYNPFFGGLF